MDDTVSATETRSGFVSIFIGREGLRAGWSLVLFILLVMLAAFGLVMGMRALHPAALGTGAGMTPGGTILQEGVSVLVVGIPALIMSLIERRRFARYNVGGPSPLRDFLKGAVSGLIMLSILVGVLTASGGIAFDGLAIGGAAAVTSGLGWLLAFLLVGLFEEFAFRGYLQFTLARGVAGIARWLGHDTPRAPAIGFWVAAVIFSIVLFAYAHTTNGGETPLGIFQVSLAGLVFVFSLWWTGSLWWAIGFHTTWDWAQSYLYGVADSGMVSQGHLLASRATGSALISGGTTGPEGSVLCIPVLLATLVVIWRTMPRRAAPILDGRA